MRLHISVDDDLVVELDRRVGQRGRSPFIGRLLRRALEDEQRWDDIESTLGAFAESTHDWDRDPLAWVRAQRAGDPRRAG